MFSPSLSAWFHSIRSAHLPIPPASSQVPSSASCCIASCYIHVTIKSSTAFLRQVSPSGTVLARCSSAVTCSIIVQALLQAYSCFSPVASCQAMHRPSNPSRQDRASQAKSSLIRSVLLSAYSRRQGHPLFLLHRLIPTHSIGQELHVSLRQGITSCPGGGIAKSSVLCGCRQLVVVAEALLSSNAVAKSASCSVSFPFLCCVGSRVNEITRCSE